MARAEQAAVDEVDEAPPPSSTGELELPITVRELYPASPPGTPGRAEATGAYKLRVVLVLASLSLFVTIYLGLTAAAVYATWLLFSSFFDGGSWLALFAAVGSAMLVLFFVKGLFAKKRFDENLYLEVSREQQPRLFRFVELLCGESGCPLPRAIYLSHEVNAAVFYPRSLLGLLLPARKNLLIGMGLLNVLNLTELKAVLGHEFGHFSQSSMKLGQYVYVANQTIYDMVVTRDRWDEWLAKWRSIDLRVSWPAWLVAGAVWLLRHLLTALFKLVNVANLSLMRPMEFNADRHAVSLTGSDAIVAGLWKAERAELAMQRALSSLTRSRRTRSTRATCSTTRSANTSAWTRSSTEWTNRRHTSPRCERRIARDRRSTSPTRKTTHPRCGPPIRRIGNERSTPSATTSRTRSTSVRPGCWWTGARSSPRR